MVDIDLCYMSATDAAKAIRAGALKSETLIENALARIEAVNPSINAFCFVYADEALHNARLLDREAAAGRFRGPLHGLPVALKDMTPTRGKRTTLGSFAYEHWVPDADATIVTSLSSAGGVLIGKTTTPEFAYGSFTESPLWGVTRNPWNLDRTAGGSSGGAGAAVAAGCVALAEGSDMGGSVRIPASFCGVVGLKPSFGRIPFTALSSTYDNIAHHGPLTRTIDDARLFMQVAQGPNDLDIQSLPGPVDFMAPSQADMSGKRIALCLDMAQRVWGPEVAASVRSCAEALQRAGAIVEEVSLPLGSVLDEIWYDYWSVYIAAFYGHVLAEYRDRMDPAVVAYIEHGHSLSAVALRRLEIERTRVWREHLVPLWRDYEALLCPTMAQVAPPHGRLDTEFWKIEPDGSYRCLDVSAVFNLFAQCPALSVPAGMDADGLPIGLQIVGRRYADADVLNIGAAIEALRPWRHLRPNI
jgi:Asp-tRNA(Asn)/Glu-tRNA(Gln) amidotransferase A subunit family amidase